MKGFDERLIKILFVFKRIFGKDLSVMDVSVLFFKEIYFNLLRNWKVLVCRDWIGLKFILIDDSNGRFVKVGMFCML